MSRIIYKFLDVEVDERNATLKKAGVPVKLSGKAFELFVELLKASPNLLSHDEIMDRVWNNRVVNDETIKQNISRIRNALGDSSRNPIYLSSVRGKGYKCVGRVELINRSNQQPMFKTDQGKKQRLLYTTGAIAFLLLISFFLAPNFFNTKSRDASTKIRLVVLPFNTHNKNDSDDYLADGLTEEFISSLAQQNNLKVLNSAAVRPFKEDNYSITDISRELNVSAIVEGSIRRMDDRIRIYVKLIDGKTQEYYWSEEFDRPYQELFSIRQEVVDKIAHTLFSVDFVKSKINIPTKIIEAYDDLLKGQAEYRKYTQDSNDKAILFFRRAVERDNNFVDAYAWLANAYAIKSTHNLKDQYAEKALTTARIALTLDPQSSLANKALGIALSNQGKYKQARIDSERTLRMRADFPAAINNLASVYMDTGRFALAAEQYKILIDDYTNELPYIPMVYAHYAACMINLGYFESADKALSKAVELDPSHPEVMIVQNTYLIETQNFALALSRSDEFVQINQDCMICLLLAADNHYLVENFDKAQEYYERIYQGASMVEMYAAIQIAVIKKLKGNESEASEILKTVETEELKYIAAGHEDSMHYQKLGNISAIKGNHEQAYQWYLKAIDAGFYYQTGFDLEPSLASFRNTRFYGKLVDIIKTEIEKQRNYARKANII